MPSIDPAKTPINPRTGSTWRISDPEMKGRVEALKEQLSADPEKAKAFLQKAGILTSSGHLSRRFGGR